MYELSLRSRGLTPRCPSSSRLSIQTLYAHSDDELAPMTAAPILVATPHFMDPRDGELHKIGQEHRVFNVAGTLPF